VSRPIRPHEAESLLRRELRVMGLTPGTPEHDGALAAGRAELSTSARLRQVQQDLAASQQDLTAALAARDEAFGELDEMREARNAARSALKVVGEQRDLAREDLAAAQTARLATERERDEARHDLAHAEFEIAKLRARLDHARAERDSLRTEDQVLRRSEALETVTLRGELERLRAAHNPPTERSNP
jgi:chromosome segregation ATPase